MGKIDNIVNWWFTYSMDIFGENNLRSLILDILSHEPRRGTDLIEEIKTLRKGTTKQGVYKALRALLKEKVVIKYRKNLMLNQIWLHKVGAFIKETDESYLGKKSKKDRDTFDWMTEGGRMAYVFKSYDALDRFHSHIFSLITKRTDPQAPLYVYNPHEWFVLKTDLKENEDYLLNWLKETKKPIYFTVGHDTLLDKNFRKKYSSEKFEIAIDEKTNYPENYYINVIGNYVIEMKNDRVFAEKLHAIYTSTEDEEEAGEMIKRLLKTKHKIKMTLSCDSQKAKKLKTKLGKNFLVPKELKNK